MTARMRLVCNTWMVAGFLILGLCACDRLDEAGWHRDVPEPGKDWRSPATGMEFVWIPQMGIWVGKYEVTNGEYRLFKPSHDSGSYAKSGGLFYSLNHDRQPVVLVNFDDSVAYAKWMTGRDQASGSLPTGYNYRLPTGDEWMRFAQCGDGREYPWGNEWPPPGGRAGNYSGQESAWSGKISGYRDDFPVTAQVDRLWSNPWRLHGVGGNVWELTTETPGGAFDAWRGASWISIYQDYLRCSYRDAGIASSRGSHNGFRLVLSCPGQKQPCPAAQGRKSGSDPGVPEMTPRHRLLQNGC